jgi:hypothetical protein
MLQENAWLWIAIVVPQHGEIRPERKGCSNVTLSLEKDGFSGRI